MRNYYKIFIACVLTAIVTSTLTAYFTLHHNVSDTPSHNKVSTTCDTPDEFGCCPGEIYTDMGDQGFNCCPKSGGDCFPPIN